MTSFTVSILANWCYKHHLITKPAVSAKSSSQIELISFTGPKYTLLGLINQKAKGSLPPPFILITPKYLRKREKKAFKARLSKGYLALKKQKVSGSISDGWELCKEIVKHGYSSVRSSDTLPYFILINVIWRPVSSVASELRHSRSRLNHIYPRDRCDEASGMLE